MQKIIELEYIDTSQIRLCWWNNNSDWLHYSYWIYIYIYRWKAWIFRSKETLYVCI